jgi:hypothetical protein
VEILKRDKRFKENYDKIFSTTGHKLTSIEEHRKVNYLCGTCNSECSSYLSNLLKEDSTKYCSKCINENTTKKCLTEIRIALDEAGLKDYELISYESNKKVEIKCPLGHIFIAATHDLVSRNRRCPECSGTRRAVTNLDKYGFENVAAAPEIKEKILTTQVEKYGGHHMKLKEFQDKRDETMKEKYDGLQFAFHSEKSQTSSKSTCKEKYGVEYPLQSESIKELMKQNSRDKFGCDYPMQNSEEFCRRQYRFKDYTFPSGKIVKVQGFEPQFIDYLLKIYDENDIITERWKIPHIKYNWIEEKDGVEINHTDCIYYPDMVVNNTFYEIKSEYTLEINKCKNLAKFKACISQGYKLDVIIYNRSGTEIIRTMEYRPENVRNIQLLCNQFTEDYTIADKFLLEKFNKYKNKVFDQTGHELLALNSNNRAKYICGSCGQCNEKLLWDLTRPTSSKQCLTCSNKNKVIRKTKETAQLELNNLGLSHFTILEYINAGKINIQCLYGHIFTTKFGDIIRRQKCTKCIK